MKSRSLYALYCLALAGCGVTEPKTAELGPAPILTVVSGADQTVQVHSEFGLPIRVRLTSASGTPMPNEYVGFQFDESNPHPHGILATAALTDGDGVAEIRFTPDWPAPFNVTALFSECVKPGLFDCEQAITRATIVVRGTAVSLDG
jgi:hypothetical protein